MPSDHVARSAEIIAFPAQAPAAFSEPALAAALADDPHERLMRAMRMLEAAQAEQREAITKWRGAIGALSHSVESLGSSLTQYQCTLNDLATRIQPEG